MTDNPHVTHQTEEITPALAEEYLEHNKLNRQLREWRVVQLMNDMNAGNWKENGEAGVTFDWNDNIAGGQHTLEAVKRSGVTIRCRVTRGVEPEARSTMNDSYKQRFSDDLTVSGVRNATYAEPLLRKIITWDRAAEEHKGLGGLAQWRSTKCTRATLATEWPRHADGIAEALAETESWHEMWPGNRGALHFMYWLLVARNANSKATVKDFFDRISYGSQDEQDQILIRVRARFLKDRFADEQVYWMCRAWNAWTRGEKLSRLQAPIGGVLSNPYPRLQRAR